MPVRIYIQAIVTIMMLLPGLSFAQLRVSQGTYITADNSNIIVEGDFNNSGTVKGTGDIIFSGSTTQTVTGNGIVNNVTLDNSNGATISTGHFMNVTGTYTPVAGTLTTNSGLVLKSDENITARISEGSAAGNYISGNVIVERYIPGGRRVFRFLGHPFTSAIALNQFQDDMDVTGQGGSANGFTATSTNNPSAFYYDPARGNGSTVKDPGWIGHTSANTNAWERYAGLYILIRGTKGQGLNGLPYTPNAVTIDWSGEINQGTQTIALTRGDSSDYVFISNPYPSQVDMSQITRGSSIGENFWAWDPNGGTKGIYISNPFNLAYILPQYSSFFTTTSANTNNTITFYESGKTGNTSQSLFKTTATSYISELLVQDSANVMWDRLLLLADNTAKDGKDTRDAVKFMNAEVNFYSLTPANDSCAIDARPYVNGKVIPLGFTTSLKKNFSIKAKQVNMPTGTDLYLHDKYLSKLIKLDNGTTYNFTVTNDTLSKGQKRFALNMAPALNGTITVYPKVTITGHANYTIYLGYGPQSVMLTAGATGGMPGYTYTWASSAGTIISKTAAIMVSPAVTTTYTVTITDAAGTIKTVSQTITVIDVRCGNGKILVCHGDNTLCLPVNSIPVHLQHGCMLGYCANQKTITDIANRVEDIITLHPNPATSVVNIEANSAKIDRAEVRIYDMTGREVLYRYIGNTTEKIIIPVDRLTPGNYLLELNHDSGKSIHKITKQ
jgi:hypothetical protein